MAQILVSKVDFVDKKFEIARRIRKEVFVLEQGVDPELEYDKYDEEASHFLLSFDGQYVGVARKRCTEQGIKLERFAIISSFRKKGLGSLFVSKLLEPDIKLGYKLYLNSQDQAVDFYLKTGFKIVGKPFYEANILHYKMEFIEQ
ncbi:MAG: GNAT family N-acetyltransferase [Flavobacteriales bacterium]